MKLAEGLAIRADQQKRLLQLRKRISDNAQVQEGDKPAEDPNKLLEEYIDLTEELLQMINKINRTNNQGQTASGLSLAEAVTLRDHLKRQTDIYRGMAEAGLVRERYGRVEIKSVSMVNVSNLQRLADDTSQELRQLDTDIQEANWTTELLD